MQGSQIVVSITTGLESDKEEEEVRRHRLLVGAHGEILEVGQLPGLGVERFAQPCHVLLRLKHL